MVGVTRAIMFALYETFMERTLTLGRVVSVSVYANKVGCFKSKM